MNETTKQNPPTPAPKSAVNISEDEQPLVPPPDAIDLNAVFPEEEGDLNDLFPDEETRTLLQKIQRNKKDLHSMAGRFMDENHAAAGDDPATNESSSEEGTS